MLEVSVKNILHWSQVIWRISAVRVSKFKFALITDEMSSTSQEIFIRRTTKPNEKKLLSSNYRYSRSQKCPIPPSPLINWLSSFQNNHSIWRSRLKMTLGGTSGWGVKQVAGCWSFGSFAASAQVIVLSRLQASVTGAAMTEEVVANIVRTAKILVTELNNILYVGITES